MQGPERAPARIPGQSEGLQDRDGRADVPRARGGSGIAAVRGAGMRGPCRGRRPRGPGAAFWGRRTAPVPRSVPLPRGPSGLQSPAAVASARAAPALGRSAVSILPEGGGGATRDSGLRARGQDARRAAAFSRAPPLGPGLQRPSAEMEKEPTGPQSPSIPQRLAGRAGGP